MKQYYILFLVFILLWSCGPDRYDPERNYQDKEKEILTQFIIAEDSSVIELSEGHFLFSRSLIMDGKNHITIRGKGIDKTVLSFKGQQEGAEGIRITNSNNITLEDLTVEDASGDNIKVMDTDGITFRRVKVAWTGPINEENGAYGFYPVICKNVLIEGCESMGASDAGLYVGQSEDVIIRNNKVYQNVAGIESENSERVEIYGNECWDNTGGILVFNLPGLTRYGQHIKVHGNMVHDNNRENFAVPGAIVGTIPPGSGIIVLATKNVDVLDNEIKDHKTVGVSVISYELMSAMEGGNEEEQPDPESGVRGIQADFRSDKNYDPFPGQISIYNNKFENDNWFPYLGSDFGKLFLFKLGPTIPDIALDGIKPDDYFLANGDVNPSYKVCIDEQQPISFVDLDAANDFENLSMDVSRFNCR
ncbi:parallel beta-helix repeat protein [Catalinimonas alkaloidigena]|uniref:parallel beta-helix domain-containing protein n=1 Tax=Catalinimonas alkaloidigena TaxID=1075417 RepID=UPI002407634F|nr:parallel beta-helix domain-containing protein [Catalinimonas alkaloidigena]MDF9800592.1 parallel beta-helix repeat protein [Catalinimonas alkaloidigena]